MKKEGMDKRTVIMETALKLFNGKGIKEPPLCRSQKKQVWPQVSSSTTFILTMFIRAVAGLILDSNVASGEVQQELVQQKNNRRTKDVLQKNT